MEHCKWEIIVTFSRLVAFYKGCMQIWREVSQCTGSEKAQIQQRKPHMQI